jgi:hypothetical protein
MKPSYKIVDIDLAVAHSRELLSETGQVVESLTVLRLPAVAVTMTIGDNSPPIPLLITGQTFEMCPPCDEVIFVTNAALGGTLTILVSFASLTAITG